MYVQRRLELIPESYRFLASLPIGNVGAVATSSASRQAAELYISIGIYVGGTPRNPLR